MTYQELRAAAKTVDETTRKALNEAGFFVQLRMTQSLIRLGSARLAHDSLRKANTIWTQIVK